MRLLLATLLTAPLAAQTELQSSGPLMAIPHGLSVGPGTFGPGGPVDPTEVLVKSNGFKTTAPKKFTPRTPMLPDYSSAAVLHGISPRPDIDALSIGLDWINADANGYVFVPPGHWGALSFSVTRASVATRGGAINVETKRADGAAADLFAYVLPGSALPPPIVDVTMRSQDSPEMNVYAPGMPGDLDAHDLYVSLLYQDNPRLVPLQARAVVHEVYFSVTSATIGLVPVGWWGGTTPSGATIFRSTWTMAGGWATPTVFLTPAAMELEDEDEVDAIAVDTVGSCMLFSTTKATLDPIMFLNLTKEAGPTVFRTPDETPVSSRIGLVTGDEVDAICALDPGGHPFAQFALGSQQPGFFPPELAATVYRVEEQALGERFVAHMAGWPPNGRGPGLSVCFLAIGAPFAPLIQLGNNPRVVTHPFGGAPTHCELRIRPALSTVGIPLLFVWAAVDQGLTTFAVSDFSLIHH